MATTRPSVVVFDAVSLDGRTTGFEADLGRYYGIARDLEEDGTLAGCDTLLSATPPDAATTGAEPATGPGLLAVVDSAGRMQQWPYWMSQPYWGRWVSIGSDSTPDEHVAGVTELGVRHLRCGRERVDLRLALEALARDFGVRRVRVESGGALNGALLDAGLVDEVLLLVHPVLVGGDGPRFVGAHADPAHRLRLTSVERVGDDEVLLRYLLPSAPISRTRRDRRAAG